MRDDLRLMGAGEQPAGRLLSLPEAPVFKLHRAGDSDYELGEFRAWAGYKNLGVDAATANLAHLQHVLSFAGTATAGRTGIHVHLAHVHIVIPTSGRAVFCYDGVVTPAVPGAVIAQHGGTVHDQFDYSYAAASLAGNKLTPQSLDAPPAEAPLASFGFLELFVPRTFANVEIVPPADVTEADERTAWDHPFHAPGSRFHLQTADAPEAAYRQLEGRPDLEARDCGTWDATGGLVATWFVRPVSTGAAKRPPIELAIAGESGGLDILHVVAGEARFSLADATGITLAAGDTLTCSQGMVGAALDASADLRLVRFFVGGTAQRLMEPTMDEIGRLEALGPAIVNRREVRPPGDTRPVNVLQAERDSLAPTETGPDR